MSDFTAGSLFDWPLPHGETVRGRLCAIGAPNDQGNPISRGAAQGPAAIRQAGRSLAAPACRGYDHGDVERPGAADPTTYLHRLATEIERLHGLGLRPLLLGGDHSLTYASIDVLQRMQELCVVWLDAHTDFSPWHGTPAHNHKQVLRRISLLPNVRHVVQIGYRGITVGDERRLDDASTVVTTALARTFDAQALLAQMPPDLPCYVSIDIDVIDPLWAPGTSAPVPDGLLPDEVADIVSTLVRHRRIVGADLVEVNPLQDVRMQTSAIAARLLHVIAENWPHQFNLPSTHGIPARTAQAPPVPAIP